MIYPSIAIFRRYAAMFRVGISFIFSRIKLRSASVTRNFSCTVLFRPSMYSRSFLLFEGLGLFPASNFQPTRRSAGGRKYGSGYPLPMLATNVFIPYALLRSYARFCQTSAKEKRCNPQKKITTLSKPYSILTDTSYLPSVSTSAISFAVALTIRMPVSLIPSRSASSCRRCVFFSGGVSKRNWSTDIL